MKQSRHEACPYVLEGEGGAVEEFEGIDVVLDLHDGTVEGERVVDDVLQGVEIHVFAEEGTCHVVGNLLERHLLDVVEEDLRQLLDFLWHIEATVFCQALDDGFLQVGNGRFSVGTVILHIFNNLKI